MSRELGHAVLFRVARDRQVWPDESRETPVTLRDYAGSLASRGRRSGDPGRTGHPVIPAWVVRVGEPDPPAGVEGRDWVLVTSVSTETASEARERRDWYACRWLVEVFHDIEKNGCGEGIDGSRRRPGWGRAWRSCRW